MFPPPFFPFLFFMKGVREGAVLSVKKGRALKFKQVRQVFCWTWTEEALFLYWRGLAPSSQTRLRIDCGNEFAPSASAQHVLTDGTQWPSYLISSGKTYTLIRNSLWKKRKVKLVGLLFKLIHNLTCECAHAGTEQGHIYNIFYLVPWMHRPTRNDICSQFSTGASITISATI